MRSFTESKFRNEGIRGKLAALVLLLLLIGGTGLTAHAEGEGGPYVTTIGALKEAVPAQRLVIKVQGYEFARTMADLATMEVVVQDNADGSRLCHIPDRTLLDTFLTDINTVLMGVPAGEGEAFYYYDALTNTIQTYPAAAGYCQITEVGREQVYFTMLQMLATVDMADQTIELKDDSVTEVYPEIPEEITANKYSLEGSCTTSFRGSSANRIRNIQIAAGNVNQLVLQPGETVSMNKAFLPRTSANGYRQAGTYVGGKVVPGMGGGICQVSSTIYNAVMNGGLTVVERHPHSMPVHYLPLGMDAAISSGSKDLKVRNDYPFPVLFEAYTEGKNLTVNIYTNDLLTAGTTYRLHAVRKGGLAANAYLEVTVDGTVTEDRFLGTSRYSPMVKEEEDEDER